MSTVKAANLQNTGSGAPTVKNSSGTEVGQFSKAWVNFNGQSTVAIKDNFNVSSITDNGTGDYTVTFTNAMANANYAYAYGLTYTSTTREAVIQLQANTQATTGFRILTGFSHVSPTAQDMPSVSVIIFGD